MAIVLIALLVLFAVPTGALGVAIMLTLVAIIVAAWALIRGRSRTFRIGSRPIAAGVLVTAFGVLVGSAGAYGAMHATSAVIAASPSGAVPQKDTAAAVVKAPAAVPKHSALAILATLTVKGKCPLTGWRLNV